MNTCPSDFVVGTVTRADPGTSFQSNSKTIGFTPVPRHGYRVGVPVAGNYTELINSDSDYYGGSDIGNNGQVSTEDVSWDNRPCSLLLSLPPLAGIILQLQAH